ncbi:MAG: hypothetical protein F6K19_25510 [Cyanothece sp. SIO1E1]|nr:hypothetical protein [Cyanothece sp. SIO1E1]
MHPTHTEASTHRSSWLQSALLWLITFFLILGSVLTAPNGAWENVPGLWIGIAVMGLGFVLSWALTSLGWLWFWSVAVITRGLLLPMIPGDDIWRYLWEGHIQNLGFSPFHLAPNAAELIAYRTEWWDQINLPDVSAIYPPITQLGFRGLAAIATSVVLFKLAFTLADLGVCWLLSRRFGYVRATLYAWNPLIIYSFAGGGHYDSWFILPLVAAWLIYDQPHTVLVPGLKSLSQKARMRLQRLGSSLLLGLSIAIKWVSLPIAGFLAWQTYRKSGLRPLVIVFALVAAPIVVSAIPFCNGGDCPLIPTSSSFVIHWRSAELIPYLLTPLWPSLLTQNWPYLLALAIIGLSLIWRSISFGQFAERFLSVLIILSPIVHLWYLTWSVPFAVASGNWGIRLMSLSGFVYFAMPHRWTFGDFSWKLTLVERTIFWLPFVLGWAWTLWRGQFHVSLNLTRE